MKKKTIYRREKSLCMSISVFPFLPTHTHSFVSFCLFSVWRDKQYVTKGYVCACELLLLLWLSSFLLIILCLFLLCPVHWFVGSICDTNALFYIYTLTPLFCSVIWSYVRWLGYVIIGLVCMELFFSLCNDLFCLLAGYIKTRTRFPLSCLLFCSLC